jgi:hypothetical protein
MVLVALTLAGAANAQYKCVAVGGALTYQQLPCPATQRQELLHPRTAPPAAALGEASTNPIPGVSGVATHLPMAHAKPPPPERAPGGVDLGLALASLESQFERLKQIRGELEAARLPATSKK